MARRNLKAALQAGKAIEEGKEIPNYFSKVDYIGTFQYGDTRDGVYSLKHSHDGGYLMVGYGDGAIQILNSRTCSVEKEVRKRRKNTLPITSIRLHPTEPHVFYAAGSEGKVHMCSLIDGICLDVASEPGNEINCMDFSSDGETFVTVGKDLDVRVYDTKTHKCIHTYPGYYSTRSPQEESMLMGHGQRIFCVKCTPDNSNVFITGGWDNHLKIWDMRCRDGIKRTIPGPHICGDAIDIKGYQILTASWVISDALQLWDYSSGGLIRNVPFPHSETGEFLYTAQFCDNGVIMAGGSGTNSAQALDTRSNQVIGEIPLVKPVQALDIVNGGRRFAVAGGGTEMVLARLS